MKKIMVAFISLCLVSDVYAKSKVMREPSSYKLENGTFSSLILSKKEMASLSASDRTTYLLSLMTFVQILETSQAQVLEKKDDLPLINTTAKSRFEIWAQVLEPKAEAIVILYPVGYAAGWAIAAGASALRAVPTLISASRSYLASRTAGAAVKVAPAVVKDIATAEKLLLTSLKEHKVAAKALDALKPGSSNAQQVITNYNNALNKLSTDTKVFRDLGGKDAQKGALLAIMNKEGVSKIYSKETALKIAGFARDGAAVYGVTKLAEGALEKKDEDSVKKFVAAAGATELAAIAAPKPTAQATAAAAAAPVLTAEKEVGHSCIFGGHPSVWKDFGGELFCTRPAASATPSCQGEKFSCQTYGLSTAEGELEGKLCAEKMPLDNLTIRCSQILTEVLRTKQARMSPNHYDHFQFRIKDALKAIEATDGMKVEQGKTKSIETYCKTLASGQVAECKAIMEVIATLKPTEVAATIASRPAVSPAVSPAVEAAERASEPAGSTRK